MTLPITPLLTKLQRSPISPREKPKSCYGQQAPQGPPLSVFAPLHPVSGAPPSLSSGALTSSDWELLSPFSTFCVFLRLHHSSPDTKVVYSLTSFKSFLKCRVFTEALNMLFKVATFCPHTPPSFPDLLYPWALCIIQCAYYLISLD